MLPALLTCTFLVGSDLIFQQTMELHFVEAKNCWHQAKIPTPRTIRKETMGMLQGASRFWPGDHGAPYRLMAVMVSESGGNTRNTAKPTEASYGPWCGTVDEVRETARLHPDIVCPRSKAEIIERLQDDPVWAALVASATLWRYDRAMGGDILQGTMLYKFGATGLRRALDRLGDKPISELPVWKHFSACYAWTLCLRDRVTLNSTPPCGCLAP